MENIYTLFMQEKIKDEKGLETINSMIFTDAFTNLESLFTYAINYLEDNGYLYTEEESKAEGFNAEELRKARLLEFESLGGTGTDQWVMRVGVHHLHDNLDFMNENK